MLASFEQPLTSNIAIFTEVEVKVQTENFA